MTMLEFHPLANLFPMIESGEFDALVADIKANGLRDQIVLLDGQILDGRNRYRAGLLSEVVPPGGAGTCFREYSFARDGDPLKFVLSKNLARRHLNESQRAMVAARLADMPAHRPDKSANLPTSQPDAAKSLNVSERLVRSAKAVQDKGTEKLNHAVDAGKLPASSAAQAAKLPAAEQDKVADMAEAGLANPVRTVIKQGLRDARERDLGQKITALPDKRYGVILADPEWEFVTFSKITGLDRSAANHYPVSAWETIGARDVQKIAARDCLCLMWVTDLKRGIAVLESWGFEYKSYFVWVKDIVLTAGIDMAAGEGDGVRWYRTVGPAGTGFWNRDRDEICLIGTRGDIPCPAMGTQGESVWFAARPKIEGTQRGKHSAKPENAHLWIEKHYPNTPKIELNARKAREGWDTWGNEAPDGDEPDGNSGGGNITENIPAAPPSKERPDLYGAALEVMLRDNKASTSYLQRKLQIGYNHASELIERLQREGVISAPDVSGKRSIIDIPQSATEAAAASDEEPATHDRAAVGADLVAGAEAEEKCSAPEPTPQTSALGATGGESAATILEPIDALQPVDVLDTSPRWTRKFEIPEMPAFLRRQQPDDDGDA